MRTSLSTQSFLKLLYGSGGLTMPAFPNSAELEYAAFLILKNTWDICSTDARPQVLSATSRSYQRQEAWTSVLLPTAKILMLPTLITSVLLPEHLQVAGSTNVTETLPCVGLSCLSARRKTTRQEPEVLTSADTCAMQHHGIELNCATSKYLHSFTHCGTTDTLAFITHIKLITFSSIFFF